MVVNSIFILLYRKGNWGWRPIHPSPSCKACRCYTNPTTPEATGVWSQKERIFVISYLVGDPLLWTPTLRSSPREKMAFCPMCAYFPALGAPSSPWTPQEICACSPSCILCRAAWCWCFSYWTGGVRCRIPCLNSGQNHSYWYNKV